MNHTRQICPDYGDPVAGRYRFVPEIFDYLKAAPPGNGDEIQMTDACRLLENHPVYAYQFKGDDTIPEIRQV